MPDVLKRSYWVWAVLAVLGIDQLTKQLALSKLVLYKPVAVFPFLNMTLAYNKGAAFGFLSDAGGWQYGFLIGIAAVASVAIVIWLWRLPREKHVFGIGLALVLGGALGNLLDRLIYGYVIDFIDFYLNSWHWPAFNVADSAICIGVFILLVRIFNIRLKV